VGLKHILETKPDVLIAIGGGSVIDAAKAIMYSCLNFKKKIIDSHTVKKPLFIAIPTTSGTGSEVTSYAVITDQKTGLKCPLTSEDMLPDIAILDPKLTVSVPPFVTTMTGIDVITHAVEAYLSINANLMTDMLAKESLALCFDNLERAVHNGSDIEARSQMHLASCLAGMAFNSAGLGITHSLAHAIGGKYHIPHGTANGIFLVPVLQYNSENNDVKARLASLSRKLKISSDYRSGESVNELLNYIKSLLEDIGFDAKLKSYHVKIDDIKLDLPDLIMSVKEDICTVTSPVKPSDVDICRFILESY